MQTKIITPKGIINNTNVNNSSEYILCIYYVYAGHYSKHFTRTDSFTLKTTLGNGYHCYSHFPDMETEAQRGENMPRFPELAMMELGFKSSQSGTKSPQAYPLLNCTLDLSNFSWPLSTPNVWLLIFPRSK